MRGVEVGHDVVGLEADPVRVGRLAAGDSFVEDVPSALLRQALASGRYVATSDVAKAAGFDVAIVNLQALPEHLAGARLVDIEASLLDGIDLAIVLTDHDAVDYGRLLSRKVTVLDTRRRLPGGPDVVPL